MDGNDHSFSIEMTSRGHIKRISVSDNPRDPIIFEGELGEIKGLRFIEGLMLEVEGINGTLRIDMTSSEFESYCKSGTCTSNVIQRDIRNEKPALCLGSTSNIALSRFKASLGFLNRLKSGLFINISHKSSLFITLNQRNPKLINMGPFAINQFQPFRRFIR